MEGKQEQLELLIEKALHNHIKHLEDRNIKNYIMGLCDSYKIMFLDNFKEVDYIISEKYFQTDSGDKVLYAYVKFFDVSSVDDKSLPEPIKEIGRC